MISYPTDPKPSFPCEISIEYKTLISQFETGKELAHQQWRFPKRHINLQYNVLTMSEIKSLWDFYVSRKGSLLPFLFFDTYSKDNGNNPNSYIDEFVGRSEGSTIIFDIPGKSTSLQTIYVDGISTAVTILTGTGDGGADQAQFSSAPLDGSLITIDFTGHIRYKMRFAQDKLSKEFFTVMLYKVGIELIERKLA